MNMNDRLCKWFKPDDTKNVTIGNIINKTINVILLLAVLSCFVLVIIISTGYFYNGFSNYFAINGGFFNYLTLTNTETISTDYQFNLIKDTNTGLYIFAICLSSCYVLYKIYSFILNKIWNKTVATCKTKEINPNDYIIEEKIIIF